MSLFVRDPLGSAAAAVASSRPENRSPAAACSDCAHPGLGRQTMDISGSPEEACTCLVRYTSTPSRICDGPTDLRLPTQSSIVRGGVCACPDALSRSGGYIMGAWA